MEIKYLYLLILSIPLIRIAIIDWREQVIYDRDIASAAVITILYFLYTGNIYDAICGGLIALGIGLIIYLAARWYFKYEAFGQGDVLLFMVLGLFFGQYFIDYFCISTCITGMLLIPIIIWKPALKEKGLPLAPIYIFWLYILLAAGQPSIFDVYFKFLYVFCWGLYDLVMFFII